MDVDLQNGPASTDKDAGLNRAEGLWFEDCGLIIQAETTIFRVSRDFLAFHSPVFKDMLSLPPPTDADMMDGCPFVLLPDTAEDVTVFLKALIHYDFFEPYPAATTLSILTGVLRMSHKYEVDALRKRGLAHISALHPTTLSEYLSLEADTTSWVDKLYQEGGRSSIIILARQLSIDWILPVAFYRICDSAAIDAGIFDGCMSKQDQMTILTAGRLLEGSGVTQALQFLWPHYPMCTSPAKCQESRIHFRRLAEDWRARISRAPPLMPFGAWESDDWARLGVCDDCMAGMTLAHREAMQRLWDGLPNLVGLPKWADLQIMKEDALR